MHSELFHHFCLALLISASVLTCLYAVRNTVKRIPRAVRYLIWTGLSLAWIAVAMDVWEDLHG